MVTVANQVFNEKVCLESLKILGDFWTLRIIDALRGGQMRYCVLQRAVGNVNPVTLTDRLKRLEDAGLVSRMEDIVDKVSVGYELTSLGLEALPVVAAVDRFSKKLTG